jgi:hypothetical protein
MSARQTQDSVAKDGSPILGLPRSPKGVWRRGRLDLTGGDLFWHDGNVHWRCRAVSDGNSPARSPSCRDCAFLPVVRYRCLCRDRCRLSVTRPDSGGDRRPGGVLFRLNSFVSVKTKPRHGSEPGLKFAFAVLHQEPAYSGRMFSESQLSRQRCDEERTGRRSSWGIVTRASQQPSKTRLRRTGPGGFSPKRPPGPPMKNPSQTAGCRSERAKAPPEQLRHSCPA